MAETDDQITATGKDSAPVTLDEPAPQKPPETVELQRSTPQLVQRRGGFMGSVLGGLLAAGVGFGLAQYVPDGWPVADTASLEATLADQAAEIAALKEALANAAPDPTLEARLASLEAASQPDLAPLSEAVAGLSDRVAAIESLPADGSSASPAAVAALAESLRKLEADVAAMTEAGVVGADSAALAAEVEAQLKAAEAQAAQVKADAEALARQTTATAALSRLQTAFDTGAPYAEHLPDLGVDIPAVLTDHAETGLPGLAALQAEFPAAARAALDAALRADMGESWTERATNFLRNQTGARSLTPREGNDPDAILSRAEAALVRGDLATTLAELSALPEPARPALADWRAKAELRLAGQEALKSLAAAIGG